MSDRREVKLDAREWRALARLRDRSAFERQVNGALRSAIDAHGPVTRESVSGASKRVASQVYAWLSTP